MARRLPKAFAALLLVLGIASPALANDLPDPDSPTAVLSLTKTVAPSAVGPGDTLVYTLQVGCSAINDVGCRGAITADTVPAPFVIDNVVATGPNDATASIDEQDITVTWTEAIGAGAIGMLDNTTSEVTITVHVPDDVSYDFNGQTVTNQALAEATNATDVPATAQVTIDVPLDLDASATKLFTPDTALAAAGTPVTAGLTGTNDSNATVDTLVIQDPTDPTATPNPFTYLGFSGFGTVAPPAGTTSTTYEVYVDGAWVQAPNGELPDDVDPGDVAGTRVTFTGAIPEGATGSVDLDLVTTADAGALDEDTAITNDIQSEVTVGAQSATGSASDDFNVQANNIAVEASKSFEPDLVVAGESGTATIGGRNDTPFPIDSLTITEPSSGSFPDEYVFGGFTAGIVHPAGATAGTVMYQPSGDEVDFADRAIPDPPTDGAESVTSFEVVFTGQIQTGAETSVRFDVDTDPDLDPADLPTTVNNEVAVEGENDGATGGDTADDDLFVYDEVVDPYIDKQVRPAQIIANPGEIVTVTLEGGTTERPDPPDDPTGTTGSADQIVIQDPLDPVEGNAWWNAFDLDAITQTPIPAGSTLTVYYYDTSDDTWKVLDGPVAGPDIYSHDVGDDISDVAGGVRFVYDYTGPDGGFAPGTELTANFTNSLRPDGRYDGATPPYNNDPDESNTLIPNCAQSDASSPTPGVPDGSAAMDPADCPEIEIIPTDGEGVGDLIDKAFGTSSSGGNKAVIARSGDTIPSTLSWSTGGYSGFDRVEVTDLAAPQSTAVADSVYDAFDLTRIEAITPDNDPYILYDQVSNVLLWNGTTWTEAANSPCDEAGCLGQMPAIDLSGPERDSTLAVRLVFAERPDRVDVIAGDLDAPPVGSGVARSFGNDREITLVWEVRDTARSDGSPVLAEDLYNLPDPGVVRNTVNATGFPSDGDTVSDEANDDVVITDVPITTTSQKTWEGGPIGVPAPGTPADQYPLSEMRVATTNTTPAKIDQLQITDPAPGSVVGPQTDPFAFFMLDNFAEITEPPGTQTTTVTLTCPDASQPKFTRDQALALTSATMPCDVIAARVLFDGRIAAGAAGVLAMDMRLRATHRVTGAQITADEGPISNTAQGIVADVDAIADCPPPDGARYACDQDQAAIELAEATFGIEAGKSISPASQKEGDFSPVTVTVSAQNTGTARPYFDTILDDDPTFWNGVDLVGMDPAWVLPTPVQFVQACYLSGGSFTAANVAADTVGGDLTCQPLPPGPPFQPGDLTLDQARAFIDDAAQGEDIHGLEFRFMAGSDLGWQNPANPLIEVPFQVQRRVELRTGGPVPTTRSDQDPAPGEADAGIFSDTVEVAGVSVFVGGDTRLEATDAADAAYSHQHLTVGVEVDKGPSGQVPPGQVIPFTLTYTNTGEAALTNPFFTDVLPSDADGNQLIFDPENDPAIHSPYSFELIGPAPSPPNGAPLPTDEAEIVIAVSGPRITFGMPEGSVLEPGQTYTITIELMLRPGLTPDDLVTNTDLIVADQPFDPGACSPNYDPDTGQCWDQSTVSPIRVAALSTIKAVKADVPVNVPGIPTIYLDPDSLPPGVVLPDDYCDTAGSDDGFYRAPCVPVTYPGDTETWRFSILNAGTLPIQELVAIDALPIPGDTGLIVTLPRGSDWEPTFVGGIQLISDNTTADLSVFYTPTSDPCTADLDPLGTGCPDGAWLPYDPAVDPETVGSLKFQVDFDTDLFDPGEQVTLAFQTRTTPGPLVDSDFPVAWNTVATGGVSAEDADGGVGDPILGAVPATEGRKVGVTYPTGPIRLEKIVSGPGAQYAPDSFTVQLTCTSEGTELTGLPEVTLTPGADPTQVDRLPWGAQCSATETEQGQTSEVIGTATVGGPEDAIGLISIENVFEVGDMSVTKLVDSAAVDQGGDPIGYGPFEVAVECTFLGDPVFADGYDAANPMTFPIEDAQVVTLADLPVGATCTTTEPDNADAVSVDIVAPTVTIGGADQDPTDVQAVTVTNHYDVGSLELEKVVTGDALTNAPALSAGPFTLQVACTLTDASHPDGEVVYSGDVTLTGVAPDNTATIPNLATGAVCEVTETDSGGATTEVVEPASVTIGSGTTVQVTATNTFAVGSMTVTKSLDSDAVDQDGVPIGYGPFQVAVSCTFEGQDVFGDGYSAAPMVHTIAAMQTWTITGLPVGATCTTTEPDSADASVDISPVAPVVIGGPDSDPVFVAAVTVTNQYDVGSLRLVKVVDGDALDNNPVVGEGPFTLHVACTLTDASHDGDPVYSDDVVLAGEQPLSATIDNLAAGAVCVVTEPGTGGATSVDIAPESVTIGDGDTVEVTATNTFEVGEMTVTKSVDSAAVDQDGDPISYGPFEVDVACTFLGDPVFADGYDAANPMTFPIEAGQTVTLEGLPVGATCVTTEPDKADAVSVVIDAPTVTIGGADQDPTDVEAVTVTNHYDVGSLHLRKLVLPAAVEAFPISQGPFTLHVACTLTDASHPDGQIVYEDDVVLQGPQPLEATIDDIAAGAVCAITETDPGAATLHLVTPESVTIAADDTVTVVTTNLFGQGALSITKTVLGSGAELYGAGPFEVSLSCTYTDELGQQVPLETPGGATRELTAENDYTAVYEPLLFGSTCSVAETRTGGATTSLITDASGQEVSDVTIDSLDQSLQINVVNTFDVGSIDVKKSVVGEGPDRFEVELTCTQDVDGTSTPVSIPGGASRELAADLGFVATYADLPAGAECRLVETDDGGALATTITPNDGDPQIGTITVANGATVTVAVENTFPDPIVAPPGGELPPTGADRAVLVLLIAGVGFIGVGGILRTSTRRWRRG